MKWPGLENCCALELFWEVFSPSSSKRNSQQPVVSVLKRIWEKNIQVPSLLVLTSPGWMATAVAFFICGAWQTQTTPPLLHAEMWLETGALLLQ